MLLERLEINQGRAKACAIISTIAYLVLCFPFCWTALFWVAATEPIKTRDFVIAFSWFWTPISLPISIYLMWSNYLRKNYKKVFLWCSLPYFAFVSFVLMNFFFIELFGISE
jgi:hypothetical protein